MGWLYGDFHSGCRFSLVLNERRKLIFSLPEFESQFLNSMELWNSCKHFIRLISLSSVHLKRACEVVIFIFFLNKQGMRACTVSKFYPRPEKNVHYMDNSKFSFQAESSSRLSFTCNCNVNLKRSLLFNRDEIPNRYTKLIF